MIVTLYLISANVYNSVDAPKTRGFSYIEIWMLGTQFPIILALLEYGFILFMKKIAKKSDDEITSFNQIDTQLDLDKIIKHLDFGTMIFSFFFFVIFTLLYWIVALRWILLMIHSALLITMEVIIERGKVDTNISPGHVRWNYP